MFAQMHSDLDQKYQKVEESNEIIQWSLDQQQKDILELHNAVFVVHN